MNYRICFAIVLSACFALPAFAEKNATIDQKIESIDGSGTVETFDKELGDPLAAVKGQWKVVDAVLVGKELESDEHAAVLNYKKANRNSVIRFSFKLDGNTEGFSFSLNHAKGHLFRVTVSPTAMIVRLDKDKKDPKSKPETLGTAKGKFEQGEWYTMQVEMVGDRVVTQTDNGLIVDAKHAKLDTDKPNYRFVMKGDSLSIDDIHVWELK